MAQTTDRALATLEENGDWLCDDCWFQLARLAARQQARRIGREAAAAGSAIRDRFATCSKCMKSKYCTRSIGSDGRRVVRIESAAAGPSPLRNDAGLDPNRVWFWEGNVQHCAIRWLSERGWEIKSSADTASKAAGVDVIALSEGRELWVTVKGFPEIRPGKVTHPATQARHWFAHALTDVIDYRGKRDDIIIAMALPGPFQTYENWIKRVTWLKSLVPFWILVVDSAGSVTPDREFP